ncbi:MAG: polyamine aminopropyltransferase [Gammaproteobacteria bacterium]|nr:MAG: polyamine aminopropyltransferase [Gammaproteobacteria bacterium]
MGNPVIDGWFLERDRGYGLALEVKEHLHGEQSPWQKIDVYATASFGNLLTLDDIVMLTSRDNFLYHEMMSHPALFTHAAPEVAVVVGGGDCGTLREVLRHPTIRRAVQVELDERVTRVCEQYFPELTEANGDPRAELLFEDAIAWMARCEPETADVVILDTTDPVGQARRLFGEPFYRDVHRALGEGGIMVAQSESALLDVALLEELHRNMKAAGFTDVRTIQFPQPTYPTGWWTATLARKGARIEGFREEAVRNRPFRTRYYNQETHRAAFALPEFLREALGA